MMMNKGLFYALLCAAALAVSAAAGDPAGTVPDAGRDLEFARRLFKDKLYDLAAQQYRQFALNYPDHQEARTAALRVGEAYFLDGKYGQAVEHLEAFIADYPDYAGADELWFKIGEAYRLSERPDRAAGAYWRIREEFGKSRLVTRAMLQAGRSYAAAGDHAAVIRTLTALVEEFGKSTLVPEARLLCARAARALGDDGTARTHLDVIVRSYKNDGVYPDARFERAALLADTGERTEAAAELQRLVKEYPDATFRPRAVRLAGRLLFDDGQYAGAASFLEAHLGSFGDAEKGAVVLRLARACRRSARNADAVVRFGELLDAPHGAGFRARARYGLAGTHMDAGRFLDATTEVRALLKEFPDDSLVPGARLLLAELYEKQDMAVDAADAYAAYLAAYAPGEDEFVRIARRAAGLYERQSGHRRRAVAVYRMLLDRYPACAFADQARAALAGHLEALGDYDGALADYEKLYAKYGEVGVGRTAGIRMRYIREFKVSSYNDAVGEMFDLVGAMVGQHGDPRYRFRLGNVYFGKLREYEKAAEAFGLFLKVAPDSVRAPEALYLTAECYQRLARKAELEGDTVRARAQRTLMSRARETMVTRYPESAWSDDIELLVLEDELGRVTERTAGVLDDMLSRYRGFLDRYADSDKLDRVLLNIGTTYLHKHRLQSADAALLESAVSFFDRVIDNFPESPRVADAFYYRALALFRNGDVAGARDAFAQVVRAYPDYSLMANAVFYLGSSLYRNGEYARATERFRSVIYNYPSSPFLVEAKTLAGFAYARLGDAEKSLVLLEAVRDAAADRGAVLLTVASDNVALGRTDAALAAYGAYLETAESDSVRLTVADLLMGADRAGEAVPHLEAVLERAPDTPAADRARNLLSGLYFERADYGKALKLYTGIAAADSALRREALVRNVVCRYRLDDLSGARQDVKAFRDGFKRDRAPLARFRKEEADYFLRQKKYERALDTYQEIVDEFERSDWLDEAMYGVVNVLFVTKEYPEALERIDAFLAKFPEGVLAADACFKAGTIHFADGAYIDAAKFFRRSLNAGPSARVAENAAFNLVLAYEKLEKYDTAIDAARNFLARFPESAQYGRVRIKEAIFLMAWDKADDAMERFRAMLADVEEPELRTEISFWIGECLFALGRYEASIEEYLRIVYFGAGIPMWRITAEYKAGMAYEKLGKTDEAKKIYEYMTVHHGIATEWGRAAAQRLKVLEN